MLRRQLCEKPEEIEPMYGMIHRGVRQMVVETRGQEAWDAIEKSLATGPEHLISAHVYDDELTVSILQRAAGELGQPLNECLRDFGRYWIHFAERGSYGAMLNFTGHNLPDFVRNLDRMHQAIKNAMPDADMPSFTVTDEEPGRLCVTYSSSRSGLEPFVQGLFEGLLARFGKTGTVRQLTELSNQIRFEILF